MDYSQYTTDKLKEMLSSIFKRGKADSKRFEFFRKHHAIWLMNDMIHDQNRQLEMIDEITAEIKRREDATE